VGLGDVLNIQTFYGFSELIEFEPQRFLDRINRPALARLLDGMLYTGKIRSGPGIVRIVACKHLSTH
jgi:hypothetical protein